MNSYPTKFKSFLWKIVQMGTLQKLQNSIQTLVMFWPVYPIHTNSLFWVIFLGLPFCHFPPPNTSIRGEDSIINNKQKRDYTCLLSDSRNVKRGHGKINPSQTQNKNRSAMRTCVGFHSSLIRCE